MTAGIPTLHARRVTLRPLVGGDAAALHAIMQDGDVMRYFPNPQPPSLERVSSMITHQLDHWHKHGHGWWAIEERHRRALVGWCGLQYLPDTSEVEVTYLLGRAFWGRGLATEAASEAVRFGFERVGLASIVALAHPDNMASQRVIEKLGMAFVEETAYFGMAVRRYILEQACWLGSPRSDRGVRHQSSPTGVSSR